MVDVFAVAFGMADADRERWIADLDPARTLVAPDPHGGVAAASHIRPFAQWFGGRPVPLGGYSPVAVMPEHRGRGLGRALVVDHFADLRDRGEVIAGLFPASVGLYRAAGFELAGSYVHRRLPAAHLAALASAPDVAVRRGTTDDVAAVHRAHERMARARDGMVSRTRPWWRHRLPEDLAATMLYVVEAGWTDGRELAGYAIYRTAPARGPYDYSVVVSEVLADEPDVLRALWRVVGSSGTQAPDVSVIGPGEDPLFLLLGAADPEAVRSEIRWMVRLVDAAGAVAARGWNPAARGRVDLSVDDQHAPWNAGRWRLEVEGGSGRLTRGGDGTVEISVQGLSSWWAGYAPARTLVTTGHVRCADPQVLATLHGLGAAAAPTLTDFY